MKMRKIYFMMLLAGALLCVPTGVKAETQVVLSEDFESNSLETNGWTKQSCHSSTGISTTASHSTSRSFKFNYNSNPPQYLISKELSVPAGASALNVSFYYKVQLASYTESFQVGYSTTDNDVANFTWDAQIDATNTTWEQYTNATFPVATKYIAIRYNSNNQYYLFVDDVEITAEVAVSCEKPGALTQGEVTGTTAAFSWTKGGTEETWQYICLPEGTEVDWADAAVQTATATSATVTGLNPVSNYVFYLRAKCSDDDQSTAVSAAFTTPCGAEALPFSEDFSSSIDCWTTQSIDGSTGIISGEFRFYYNSNPPQYLISPELTASAKEAKVTFDYRANSASYPETFQVGYSTTTNDVESAFTWSEETTSTNTTAEKYEQVLPAGVKYVSIKYTANDQFSLFIDNFSVAEYEAPACEMPTGLAASEITANSAKIAWTSEATAWKLQTSTDGENWTDVEGEITNPYTLNALTENTKYYVRVCANCGANGDSEWTAAINFTTDCAVKSLPFATEGFESGVLPDCWSAASQWTIYSYPNDGHDSNTAMRFNASTTADLTLPTIALNDKAQLTFWRRSSSVSCSVYVNDGEGETNLGDFEKSSDWTETTVDLSAYAGKTVTIIIRGNYYGYSRYLYIDDVTVNYAPVAAVTHVEVTPADGKATVTWECAEEGAAFNLQYRAKGADEWTTVDNLTEATYTIEGLTNETEYEVQIQAVASANRISEWAEAVSFTPVACPEVTGMELTDKTYNSVKVSWTATGNGTWILEYSDGTTFKQVNDLTATEYVLANLSTGTTYTIKVKPVCAGGWHKTTTFVPTYTAPASVSVTNATDTGAVASWEAVADAEGYEYIVVVKDAEVNWENAVAATETSAELKGLNGLTDYDFYVRATYPENGASEYAQAEFSTIAYAPANLTAGEITTTTATFTWEANGAATRYQWSTDGEHWSEPQTAKEATAENLTAATTYTFSVRACYAEGKYSEPVTQDFTTDCDTFVLPFEEDFEKAGALPNCWDAEPQWTMDAYNYYKSAYYSARFNANTANSAELKTPAIRLDKKAELSFFLRNVYGANAGYVEGKVIAADVENGENKVEAEFIQSNAENLSEQKLDLSALLGKTVKITFLAHGVGTSTNASLYIDDVKVTEITEEPVATGMDNTSAAEQVIKTVENGQIVIILNGVKYNAQGQKL